jgi:transcriptional regulator with XRE-family HTH domain
MVFTDYMKSLPNQQQETIKKLAEITCSTPAAVYRWINGVNPPTPIKQKIIAEYLGMNVEELFPSKNESNN